MADWSTNKDGFDRLLSWLNPNRSCAGKRYESIRRKLILIFASHRWRFPEEMADDCINRVIKKLPEIEGHYQGPPEAYFHGVAKIIELEWRRKDLPIEIPDMERISPETEEHLACLDRCLSKLPQSSGELVMEYYQQEKQAKIDHRAALARKLGIAANALRIRAHRIRQHLEKCVLECLGERALA